MELLQHGVLSNLLLLISIVTIFLMVVSSSLNGKMLYTFPGEGPFSDPHTSIGVAFRLHNE